MRILSSIFGCSHARLTFPQTEVRSGGVKGDTTQCCLDCGARFLYEWDRMAGGVEVIERGPRKTWRRAAVGGA